MLLVVLAWVTVFGPHQPSDFRDGGSVGGRLLQQLVADLPRRLLLRPVRGAGSRSTTSGRCRSRSSSTSSGRSCCCSGSARFPRRGRRRGVRPRLGIATLGLALALGDPDGRPLQAGHRPVPGLLRDRHPGARAAGRRGAGDGLAEPTPARPRSPRGPGGLIDGAGAAGLGVIALMFWRSSEFSPFLYRGGFLVLSLATVLARRGDRRIRPTRLGADRRLPADALDRRALLRHLPLALPDHRPDHARRGRRASTCRAPSSRSRRRSWSPRSRGTTSRTRSATARSAGSGGAGGPARSAAAGSAARVGRDRGVGRGRRRRARRPRRRRRRARARPRRPGTSRVATTLDDSAVDTHRRSTNRTTCDSVDPHRRLDLGGAGLLRLPAEAEGADRRPVRRGSARRPSTSRSPGRARSTRRFEGQPNAEDVAPAWKAAGLRRLLGARARDQRGRQRRRRARRSATTSGSTG